MVLPRSLYRKAAYTPRVKARKKIGEKRRKAKDSELICIACDCFFFKRAKGRASASEVVDEDPECLGLLRDAFASRGTFFCPKCASTFSTAWKTLQEKNDEFVSVACCFFDRDFGSGNATVQIGNSFSAPQPCLLKAWGYRINKFIFDFDQTSRNMRSAILSAQTCELGVVRARQIMQTKNLTTGIGRDVDRMTVEMETEETGKLRRMGIWDYILEGKNIGPFAGQFVLYHCAIYVPSNSLRAEYMAILEKVWNADWGTSFALAFLVPECEPYLPHRQKDATPQKKKVCKLLTIMTYCSVTGRAIRSMVRQSVNDKLFFFNFTVLHWEFLLCEIRKLCDGSVRALYKDDEAIDRHVCDHGVWWPCWK